MGAGPFCLASPTHTPPRPPSPPSPGYTVALLVACVAFGPPKQRVPTPHSTSALLSVRPRSPQLHTSCACTGARARSWFARVVFVTHSPDLPSQKHAACRHSYLFNLCSSHLSIVFGPSSLFFPPPLYYSIPRHKSQSNIFLLGYLTSTCALAFVLL